MVAVILTVEMALNYGVERQHSVIRESNMIVTVITKSAFDLILLEPTCDL